jgi:arylsulfatase A-like enzyme
MNSRLIFIAGAMLATSVFGTSVFAEKPNILFIFSDDHAAQSISAYGINHLTKLAPTPNIDRIAEEGVLFKNNFCTNSICAPSRACVLTGKHSHINGQRGNGGQFDGSQSTFPKLLQQAGYQTALFGKWHLKSNPTGFDQWMVYPDQGSYYNPKFITPTGTNQLEGYSVELVTDLSLNWLKENKDSDKPFLLMCQYKAPHRWWMPGPNYLNKFDEVTFPEPDTLFDDYRGRTSSAAKHKMGVGKNLAMGRDLKVSTKPVNKSGPLTPEQLARWNAAYGPKNQVFQDAKLKGKELVRWKYQRYIKDYLRCVAAVDDNVGRLLAYLEESGLDENTIVVYSTDQGFYLGEHGWFDKRWMYEESFREPLMMRWKGRIKPGTQVTQLTQNIDYAPTFLEAAGIAIPEDIQGESLLPLLNDSKTEWRKSIYYHYYADGGHGVSKHYGVRNERYKLIHFYGSDEWELFDLKTDPHEMKSEYDNPEYKTVRARMHKELDRLRAKYKNNEG